MVTHVEHKAVTDTQITPAQGLKTFAFETLPLQLGGQLGPVTVAYETWGSLNAAGDNAVLIAHALTGSSHAHDAEHLDNTKVAWWNPLIGPGRFFDTSRRTQPIALRIQKSRSSSSGAAISAKSAKSPRPRRSSSCCASRAVRRTQTSR